MQEFFNIISQAFLNPSPPDDREDDEPTVPVLAVVESEDE